MALHHLCSVVVAQLAKDGITSFVCLQFPWVAFQKFGSHSWHCIILFVVVANHGITNIV